MTRPGVAFKPSLTTYGFRLTSALSVHSVLTKEQQVILLHSRARERGEGTEGCVLMWDRTNDASRYPRAEKHLLAMGRHAHAVPCDPEQKAAHERTCTVCSTWF